MNWYYCNKCSGVILRDLNVKKIKSVCEETGESSIIHRIDCADELTTRLRRKYLKELIEIKSFKPKEMHFINIAFEQGAAVVFNRLNIKAIKEDWSVEYEGFK